MTKQPRDNFPSTQTNDLASGSETFLNQSGIFLVNQSSNVTSQECIYLPENLTLLWNNPNSIIPQQAEEIFETVKSAVLIPILFFIGFPANVINMVVFAKHGLKERINTCLFALALADILYLCTISAMYVDRLSAQGWSSVSRFGPVYRYMVDNSVIVLLSSGYCHIFLVALVSTERCICVTFPLRAQRCLSTRVIACVIIVTSSVLVALLAVSVQQYQMICYYEAGRQRVLWKAGVSDFYYKHINVVNVIDGIFFGLFVSVVGPLVVLVTAFITSISLLLTMRWRRLAAAVYSSISPSSTTGTSSAAHVSARMACPPIPSSSSPKHPQPLSDETVPSSDSPTLSATIPPSPSSSATSQISSRAATASASHSSTRGISSKELALSKMLVILSLTFFVLHTPLITLRLMPRMEPRFNLAGPWSNLYTLFMGLRELCAYASSTVNFFIYLFTGTRYRQTLNLILQNFTSSKKSSSSSKSLQRRQTSKTENITLSRTR